MYETTGEVLRLEWFRKHNVHKAPEVELGSMGVQAKRTPPFLLPGYSLLPLWIVVQLSVGTPSHLAPCTMKYS